MTPLFFNDDVTPAASNLLLWLINYFTLYYSFIIIYSFPPFSGSGDTSQPGGGGGANLNLNLI